MNEKTMIKLIQKHDSKALEKLIDTYSHYVSAVIYSVIGTSMTREDIEEVASDVFLEVWKNPDRLSEGKVKSFLASVARNLSYNKLRELSTSLPLEDDFQGICEKSEREIERFERTEIINEALNALKAKERDILLKYYYSGKTSREISEELSISVTNVTTILSRARRKLHKYLKSKNILL